MADLEFEGTFEEQWGTMKSAVRQNYAAINGNGQPGLLDFASGIRAQLRLLIVLVSIAGLVLALLTYLEANRQLHAGTLHAGAPTLAETQDAGLPSTYAAR